MLSNYHLFNYAQKMVIVDFQTLKTYSCLSNSLEIPWSYIKYKDRVVFHLTFTTLQISSRVSYLQWLSNNKLGIKWLPYEFGMSFHIYYAVVNIIPTHYCLLLCTFFKSLRITSHTYRNHKWDVILKYIYHPSGYYYLRCDKN